MANPIPQDTIQRINAGQTTSARVVQVLDDGTIHELPAGSQVAFLLADPTVASMQNNGNANPCAFTGTNAPKISDVRATVKLPDGTSHGVQQGTLMVLPVQPNLGVSGYKVVWD